ncbi:hypothetical protein DFAR_3190004 [Desulfarculales bacterium]
MLCAAVVFPYTSVIGGKAVLHANPLLISAVYPFLVGLGVVAILRARRQMAFSWPRRF